MKRVLLFLLISVFAVSMLLMGTSCKKAEEAIAPVEEEVVEEATTEEAAPAEEEVAEVTKIKIALAPYQDVAVVIVGIEKGFFTEEGLEPEIIPIAWADCIEVAASKSVDISVCSDGDLAGKIENVKNVVFTNLLLLWEADALFAQKGTDLKLFEDFKAEGLSDYDAAKAACAQLKGLSAVVPRNSSQENFLGEAARFGGLDFEKDIVPYIIDMGAEEGLPAFLRGEGDIFLPGIPQIQQLTERGYPVLIYQHDLPLPGVIQHAGFVTSRDFAENNFDTVVKFQSVLYKSLKYISENEVEGFTIICDYINKMTAAGMTPEDLKNKYWNIAEYFPLPEEAYRMTILPDGTRYWKGRWENVFQWYVDTGVISEVPDLEEYILWPKVYDAYMTKYEPDLYKSLKEGSQ